MHGRGAEPVLACPTIVEEREDVQEGGLPCSGGAHDGNKFALANGEIDAAQHPGFGVSGLVTAFDILKVNHVVIYSDLKADKSVIPSSEPALVPPLLRGVRVRQRPR